MFKLDIKINCIHLGYVSLLVSDTYVTFYTKLQIMTFQITCIRINHDTRPEIYMMRIYILIENVHFYIFAVVYKLTCNEVKSSKYLNMLISM